MISFLAGDNPPKNPLPATNDRVGDKVGEKRGEPGRSGEQARKNTPVFIEPGEDGGKLVIPKAPLTSTFGRLSPIHRPTTTTTLYLSKAQKMGKTQSVFKHRGATNK